MIREGQASEALSYLRTESRELRMSGYELVENNLIFLPTFTMDSIRYVLNLLAQRSICRHDKKHIMPSVGAVIARLTPHTDEERGLLAIWEKNVALIYAEE